MSVLLLRCASARRRASWLLALWWLLLPRLTIAQGPPPLGEEFQVSTNGEYESSPAVAMDGEGRFLVVWHSDGPDGSGRGILGRRYDAAGEPTGEQFQVNTHTAGNQRWPAVAVDATGNFVVVWSSNGQDGSGEGVFGQRYDEAGRPVGEEFQVNTYTADRQTDPAVAADPSGNFIIVWQSDWQDGSQGGIFGQRFDAEGDPVGEEFQVNTYTTRAQIEPSVATDQAGNFVVVWTHCFGYSYFCYGAINGQLYDATGNRLGGEFEVVPGSDAYGPVVAKDPTGNFVVVWSSYYHDGGAADDIFARRFDADGGPQGAEFLVNSHTTSFQYLPALAMDAGGDFTVVWQSYVQDGSYRGIFGQRYEASGDAVGDEFQINTYTTGDQAQPAIAADAAGNFVVVWVSGQDSGGIFGQRFQAPIFEDGFESGDTGAWDQTVP